MRTLVMMATLQMLLATGACPADSHPIEKGTYIARFGEDRIVVGDEGLHFVVTVTVDGQPRVLDKSYPYNVLENGRILPYRMRSVEAVYGIGRFDWYWDGKEIIQKDASGAEVNRFVRQP